jgi:hypothetical protein
MPSTDDVQQYVVERVAYFSGAKRSDMLDCYLDRDLRLDPDDFIELCEDLERTFDVNLRPFFEEGVPERRWWIFWTHPVARDVSVRELADHIGGLTGSS